MSMDVNNVQSRPESVFVGVFALSRPSDRSNKRYKHTSTSRLQSTSSSQARSTLPSLGTSLQQEPSFHSRQAVALHKTPPPSTTHTSLFPSPTPSPSSSCYVSVPSTPAKAATVTPRLGSDKRNQAAAPSSHSTDIKVVKRPFLPFRHALLPSPPTRVASSPSHPLLALKEATPGRSSGPGHLKGQPASSESAESSKRRAIDGEVTGHAEAFTFARPSPKKTSPIAAYADPQLPSSQKKAVSSTDTSPLTPLSSSQTIRDRSSSSTPRNVKQSSDDDEDVATRQLDLRESASREASTSRLAPQSPKLFKPSSESTELRRTRSRSSQRRTSPPQESSRTKRVKTASKDSLVVVVISDTSDDSEDEELAKERIKNRHGSLLSSPKGKGRATEDEVAETSDEEMEESPQVPLPPPSDSEADDLEYNDPTHQLIRAETLKLQGKRPVARGGPACKRVKKPVVPKDPALRNAKESDIGETQKPIVLGKRKRERPRLTDEKSHQDQAASLIANNDGISVPLQVDLSSTTVSAASTRSSVTVSPRQARSRSSGGPTPDHIQCHICSQFNPKIDSLACLTCSRGVCASCLLSEYASIAAYTAIFLFLGQAARLKSLAQEQVKTELAETTSESANILGTAPAEPLDPVKNLEPSKPSSIGCIADLSQLDFQCPVCKAICHCAKCLRGPAPKLTSVHVHKKIPSSGQAIVYTSSASPQSAPRSRRRRLSINKPTPVSLRRVAAEESSDVSEDDGSMLMSSRNRDTCPSRPSPFRIKIRPSGNANGRSRREVVPLSSEEAIALEALRRREMDELIGDSGPTVAVRKAGAPPSEPRFNNSVPRLGSPPRPLARRPSPISRIEVPVQRPSRPVRTSNRVRIGTKLGQRLGKTPASLRKERIQRFNEPVFTLGDGSMSNNPGKKQDPVGISKPRSITSYTLPITTTSLLSLAIPVHIEDSTDSDVIPDFSLASTAPLPELEYSSPEDGLAMSASSLPSPHSVDDTNTVELPSANILSDIEQYLAPPVSMSDSTGTFLSFADASDEIDETKVLQVQPVQEAVPSPFSKQSSAALFDEGYAALFGTASRTSLTVMDWPNVFEDAVNM